MLLSNRKLPLIFICAFVFFWLASLIFVYKISTPAGSNGVNVDNGQSSALHDHRIRLTKALQLADRSRQDIDDLNRKFDDAILQLDAVDEGEGREKLLAEIEANLMRHGLQGSSGGGSPSPKYEEFRRRIESNIKEFWNFAKTETKKLSDPGPVLQLLAEHKNSLLNDMEELRRADGHDQWRTNELQSLSVLVQKRLHYIQNPPDCASARKLVCRLNKGCGYGCQIHHVVYCFIMAYATERTLILKSESWRYNRAGWEQVFLPLSNTCKTADGARNWPASDDVQVVQCPIIDSLNPRPQFLPLAIPADLAPRLMRVHGDPAAWWIGQFLKYLLRYQPQTQEMVDRGIEKLNFRGPIVGVHVRRTDKVGTEAAYHNVDEYMAGVNDYYNQVEMRQGGGGGALGGSEKRRVFIASDDPQVLTEARKKYPEYEIIGDPTVAKGAAVSTRYSDASLNGIILDTHLLAHSDYLVCTFSSQVCRLAYEIRMGQTDTDVSNQYTSLDDIYYYGGQNAHSREAVLPHKPHSSKEIHLRPGDLVGIAGNHWDGYSKGHNENTNQGGLFPSFKVRDKVRITDFPTYAHVK